MADKKASKKERSFIAVKPDGVQRGLVGEIVRRFEVKGFKLVAMKMLMVGCWKWATLSRVHARFSSASADQGAAGGALRRTEEEALLSRTSGVHEHRPGGCHGEHTSAVV